MIGLENVTDIVRIGKLEMPVAIGVTMQIPRGHYALLAAQPQVRRHAIDLLCGSRPPKSGVVLWNGRCSWPVARPGFIRGRLSGFQLITMISRIYGLDPRLSIYFVEEMLSRPPILADPIGEWDALSRQELAHTLALIPIFDTYLIDGVFPNRKDSFTRKWRCLFADRLEGKTLILATTRVQECKEFCDRALVLHDGRVTIEDRLDELLDHYPLRALEFGARGQISEREPDELF